MSWSSANATDWRVSAVLGGYFGLNVAYTAQLKHVAYVDIACIALGFLLRVLAGGLATRVAVSGWLLASAYRKTPGTTQESPSPQGWPSEFAAHRQRTT